MEVTLGGDRLGSGNKQKQEMHEYNRASFNQEQDFKSSMAPGILYPFLCIPMTNGDSMDIDLDAFVRTLPTKGPLFGSFKLQADIFSVPMRLYNGVLHNNPNDIGLKMAQVYTPKLELHYDARAKRVKGTTDLDWQVNPTSLLKYLGLSGIGYTTGTALRKINAIPALGYYDIFKNYYANKQEENAYVIEPGLLKETTVENYKLYFLTQDDEPDNEELTPGTTFNITEGTHDFNLFTGILQENLPVENYSYFKIKFNNGNWINGQEAVNEGFITPVPQSVGSGIMFNININLTSITIDNNIPEAEADIVLTPFKLKNIDDMRYALLSKNEIGQEFIIGKEEDDRDWNEKSGSDGTGLPYSALIKGIEDENQDLINQNSFIQNGLVVKTYQSDIYQNWINTDWIEGENGIAAISSVDVSEGSFTIDALNIAQKVYNMLNRVALSGGTYEDWQEAVYTQQAVRKAETPVYEGGMAAEVMFEEVISSAETKVDGDFQALGSLGGKGTMVGQRGGKNIHIKAREPIFVMGIVSLTPKICYTQGNEWYLTELDNYDNLHKPAFDQIGFQDLITEQLAWWDTRITPDPITHIPNRLIRHSAGKIVAWSNYMTAVDKAYGDFARPLGKGFMALSRNYEMDEETGRLKDCTTYIDPAKFNYAFAYTDLAAQNFWVQIHSKIITRRVMSAHQIPNL